MARDGSPTQTSTTRLVLRQRSPLTLAAVCGATGVLVLGSIALQWADNPQPLFVAWVLLALAVVWSLFVRPAVLFTDEGVTIRNVVRNVHIPWALVTDVECRWNLKVFVGDEGYVAWGISSQVERPQSMTGGMFGNLMSGQLSKQARADAPPSTPAAKVTASMVARSIEQAREEYAEAVAQGALPAAPDARVRITREPLSMAIMVLPAIAIVVLALI